MLTKLSIKNYTLIEALELGFEKGFTVITGETGAGKSILLGALSLILGKRADLSVLMDKDRKCVVEGEFDLHDLDLEDFFEANDLDFDRLTLMRREILPSGKSRAFINDTPVNLTVMKALGEQLVDIHSQHQTLLLNDSLFQLELYDGYVNQGEVLRDYRQIYRDYRLTSQHLAKIREENARAKRDEDYLRFQLNELEAARLDEEEASMLEEKVQMLTHAEEISQATAMAVQLLKENEFPVIDQLNRLRDAFYKLADFHPDFKAFYSRLESSVIELADLTDEIERFSGSDEFNPAELQSVQQRLDTLYALQQKHHAVDMADLIRIFHDYQTQLSAIQSLDEQEKEEEKKLNRLRKSLSKHSDRLHVLRMEKLPHFERAVEHLLHQLGMKEAVFKVRIDRLERFGERGQDDVRFLFNANKGGQLTEIAKSASGGELSRLMLALKSLVHQVKVLPTIIFDEIDAGVSGEIGGKIGNILKEMAVRLQVMSITHLPQIAAKADMHFKVYKTIHNDRTTSVVERLDDAGRMEEIAKMLSDENVTDAARQAALELLKV
jgi:DNA repair protein RecN (Recombination protein N)